MAGSLQHNIQHGESTMIAEAVSEESLRIHPSDHPPLSGLWRSMLEALVYLAQRPMSSEDLQLAMEAEARRQLDTMCGQRKIFGARLLQKLPLMFKLPQFLELAQHGLHLTASAPVMARADDSEVIAGKSPAFAALLRQLDEIAASEMSVLLIGESGCGKSMLAQRLHQMSPRHNKPFVEVNCAGLSSGLWESELFGHVRGAFTGAVRDSAGYFRTAHSGTLFLDEIGVTSLDFQARLLKVLDGKKVNPVGSSKAYPVDYRLVAASHISLDELVAQGKFLESVMYRLKVIPIYLPPLRERREDIPERIDYFLQQAELMVKYTRNIHPETRKLLVDHDWPGNVRELMNTIYMLVGTVSNNFTIMPHHLPEKIRKGKTRAFAAPAPLGSGPIKML